MCSMYNMDINMDKKVYDDLQDPNIDLSTFVNNIGSNIPTDSRAGNTNIIKVTTKITKFGNPDFENPTNNAQIRTINQSNNEKSNINMPLFSLYRIIYTIVYITNLIYL